MFATPVLTLRVSLQKSEVSELVQLFYLRLVVFWLMLFFF